MNPIPMQLPEALLASWDAVPWTQWLTVAMLHLGQCLFLAVLCSSAEGMYRNELSVLLCCSAFSSCVALAQGTAAWLVNDTPSTKDMMAELLAISPPVSF